MVRDQANVGKSPTEDISEDEDCGILGVASDVCLRVVEGGLLARSLAVPLKAGFAVLARHSVRVVLDSRFRNIEKRQLSKEGPTALGM
jgi:hypothetical protein